MAEVTSARRPFARRKRVRAETGADETGRARVHAPAEAYRTFPARLATILFAVGGALLLLGALGPGIRASGAVESHEDPRTVGVLMGSSQGAGWVLAALALVLGAVGVVWLGRNLSRKLGASMLAVIVAVIVAGRLSSFDKRAQEWAAAASGARRYVAYHAGFGWGAWFLLLGVIVAAFGVLVGLLREADLRRGVAE